LYMGPVEVITSVARRRRWSPEEKRAMVQEAESPGMSVSSVARKYGIHPNQLFRWRRLMYEGALCAVKAGEEVVPATEVKALRERIRELERLLGTKTMEVEMLKEAIAINSRNPVSLVARFSDSIESRESLWSQLHC